MRRIVIVQIFGTLLICTNSPVGQVWDIESDSSIRIEKTQKISNSVTPPADWKNWTPEDGMLRLYVNTDNRAADTLPRIDIMTEKGSWPFSMQQHGDTVYLFVVPPGYSLPERSALNNLPSEFPLVVWAGTERATYWFSYDSGNIEIEALRPAPFINTMSLQSLPADVVYLQLPGSGKHAKTIKKIVTKLKGEAELIQLEDGFYKDIWFHVTKTTIRTWKLNEVAFGTKNISTLLVFRVIDPNCKEKIKSILDGFR